MYGKEGEIRTKSGIMFNVFEPDPDKILIEDIAWALSMNSRWGGHANRFYSIAQHSIHACRLGNNEDRLALLLHDASEAYLADMPTPIKRKLPDYIELENKLMMAISEKFGFQYPLSKEVKAIDKLMLSIEWKNLMLGQSNDIPHMTQIESYDTFIDLYKKVQFPMK